MFYQVFKLPLYHVHFISGYSTALSATIIFNCCIFSRTLHPFEAGNVDSVTILADMIHSSTKSTLLKVHKDIIVSIWTRVQLQPRSRIFVQFTIYRRLLTGRDGHLAQSEARIRALTLLELSAAFDTID